MQQSTTSTRKLGHAHVHVAFSPDTCPCVGTQKPCQGVGHARACVAKISIFAHPYNPHNREQVRQSGDKVMKLAIKQTLQFIAGLSALFRCLDPKAHSDRKGGGSVTDTNRSLPGLSVDWQAWGTQRGLCWRATRDSVRHVPAGPPKSVRFVPASAMSLEDISKPAGKPRFPAPTAIFLDRQGVVGIPTRKTRGTAPQSDNCLSVLPLLPGLEKTRSLFPREVRAGRGRGEWGVSRFSPQLIPTHQVTRGNQSKNPDSRKTESY
jgi:hypothetical protein